MLVVLLSQSKMNKDDVQVPCIAAERYKSMCCDSHPLHHARMRALHVISHVCGCNQTKVVSGYKSACAHCLSDNLALVVQDISNPSSAHRLRV